MGLSKNLWKRRFLRILKTKYKMIEKRKALRALTKPEWCSAAESSRTTDLYQLLKLSKLYNYYDPNFLIGRGMGWGGHPELTLRRCQQAQCFQSDAWRTPFALFRGCLPEETACECEGWPQAGGAWLTCSSFAFL